MPINISIPIPHDRGDFTAEVDSSEYPSFRSDQDRCGQGFG